MKNKLILFVLLITMIFVYCERKTNPANPNSPPNTTLANIPVDNDTLFALVKVHWDGEDFDGFIAGYEYRYITQHIFMGDSVVQPWTHTTETSVTIPFESSDILNHQRFQVRAIDDHGLADPSPAEKRFYTVQTIFPETEILVPQDEQQFFIIEETTDWWEGVPLTYRADDADGEVVEYAWKVDNGEWNWTTDTTLYIHPSYFQPLSGPHQIYAISRDNTNLVDPVGDTVEVILVQPTFTKNILVIDETNEILFTGALSQIEDADVDDFYARMFSPDSAWDFYADGMPPKSILGQFKLLIWHADNPYSNPTNVHQLPANIEDVKDYLHVGGDLIMGGWRILKSFAQADDFPKTFEEGSFIHDYLHIKTADETILIPTDFVGVNPYPNVTDTLHVDESKLLEFPYFGKLGQINVMPERAGFTDVMYVYANLISSTFFQWRGQPVGIRYYGTSFNTIVLGFPMFFIQESDAQIMADQMLNSLGYQ